jgi:competence protein ComEC
VGNTNASIIAYFCTLFNYHSLLAQELKIIHIKVRQRDATLILGPSQQNGQCKSVLFDAGDITMGGDNGGAIVWAVLSKEGVSTLDYFIVSHYDADHIGGAITVRQKLSTNY